MTPRQADRIIKDGKTVTFFDARFKETFSGTPVHRNGNDLHINYMVNGKCREGVFARDELEIVNQRKPGH